MKTVLPGTLTAMRASGKLTQKSCLEYSLDFPVRIGEKRLFWSWRRIHVSDALWLPIPYFPFRGPALS